MDTHIQFTQLRCIQELVDHSLGRSTTRTRTRSRTTATAASHSSFQFGQGTGRRGASRCHRRFLGTRWQRCESGRSQGLGSINSRSRSRSRGRGMSRPAVVLFSVLRRVRVEASEDGCVIRVVRVLTPQIMVVAIHASCVNYKYITSFWHGMGSNSLSK